MPKTTRKKSGRSERQSRTRKRTAARPQQLWTRLDELARNLWWTWNPPARRLFESLDPLLWNATNHNPVALLAALTDDRRAALADDQELFRQLESVESDLAAYLSAPTWFDRKATSRQKDLKVAYFCMEYGLHESVPLYSGGLGVLAGDHLRSASDLGIPLIAIGMLWRHGYYRQEIDRDGTVRALYPRTDFGQIPVRDTGREIEVTIGRSNVRARIWSIRIGRVDLYLLDTDLKDNKPRDRRLTYHLYGGDNEDRIRQEVLLGVGGLKALDALRIKPTVYHLNEGHAAFSPLERVRRLVAQGASFEQAVSEVRKCSVFTTHTPVPAGNDRFEIPLFSRYMGHMARELGLSKEKLLALGREDPSDHGEPFCMTVLALKLSERCNGVAELHGDTSRRMWMKTFNADSPENVPIGHVTNGIHPETWIADEARPFYDKHLRPEWVGAGPDDDWWARARNVPDSEIWKLRQTLRAKMVTELRSRLRDQLISHHGEASDLLELYDHLDEDALTIGFARRFATYKRAPLIFRDRKRLARIMGNPNRPVQFIFAGKAHPRDAEGNEFVQKVYQYARQAPFRGRIFVVENYDMHIGRMLTQGCDVWLNNPVRPMEASGTSGMKPPLNGGLNCSILDGWWPEGYNGRNGWAIGDGSVLKSRAQQDKHDAEALYETLETQVLPLFYSRDSSGVPKKWVRMIIECMTTVCARFSTHRMLADYLEGYYLPSHAETTRR